MHNQKAYLAAEKILQLTGKAAIIHPTGTGKSFIGLKMAEEHPADKVIWLSPSEYIFKTQMENLRAEYPDCELTNITFLTYAKLMLMTEDAMQQLSPDYIILDEFHRCGAAEWGRALSVFLTLFPNAKLLGLSATHVRYLDNQRDMAQELFDGHIASYMTLGEAIALGILNSPIYVTSVYSYQQELERYQQRIWNLKSAGYREENQKYLDALRRSLEQAEGLSEIFKKHMKNQTGKYILFCSSKEHMEEMLEHVEEWFGDIDVCPHIYQVYSEDSAADRTFSAFKTDNSSHLKLLFCIDMLNEGVHVDKVDGVILFRPTTSPIIYKQQIGRALSAGCGKQPIIFDIVNNFDSLYSISSIQEEINLAVTYYRNRGEGSRIVNEKFEIRDEVRQCRKLFEDLERSLSAPWEICYQAAKEYYKEHGDLNVPKRYRTAEGISLGQWIATQKRVRSGQTAGNLSEGQIARLDAIGMVWGNRLEINWEKYFAAAEQYYKKYGNLDVRMDYVTEEGLPLGKWIYQVRQSRAGNIHAGLLNAERIARLDAIGMIWSKFSYLWEQNYQAALRYYLEYGDLEVPVQYQTADGLRLGQWISSLRRRKNSGNMELTQEQAARLEAIGMRWESAYERQWETGYQHARQYYEQHGNLNLSGTYITPDGFYLGKWLYKQRIQNAQGHMSKSRQLRLEAIGMQWKVKDSWQENYEQAKQYYEENGHLDISQDYVTPSGNWLGKWLYKQRQGKDKLTKEQIALLTSVGMEWRSKAEKAWDRQYDEARKYYQEHGSLRISSEDEDNASLNRWIKTQRKKRKENKLSDEQAERLEAIGMEWKPIRNVQNTEAIKKKLADKKEGFTLQRWIENPKIKV